MSFAAPVGLWLALIAVPVIALYILFCAIVSITATSFLPDYTNRDISQEHDWARSSTPTSPAPFSVLRSRPI